MSTINKLNYKIKELQSFAASANFEVKISSAQYPISVKFYEKQVDLFSEEVTDAAPTICFILNDEMSIVTSDNFKTNEAVFDKMKKLSKDIDILYLRAFREEVGTFLSSLKQDDLEDPLSIKRGVEVLMREMIDLR